MSQLVIEQLEVQSIGPIDLSVPSDKCFVLTGASGSGKTLLLRAIADVIPHAGTCYLDQIDARDTAPANWRRKVGMLPAESQWWAETVGEHFTDPDPQLLQRLGFEMQVMKWSVSRLSTGEKQRLALVRLLTNEPQCLLLDEPTASLDAANTREVETIIAEYAHRHEAPVLWVTHDAAQTRRVADRIYLLKHGHLREQGA